jgi:hypothetical protein
MRAIIRSVVEGASSETVGANDVSRLAVWRTNRIQRSYVPLWTAESVHGLDNEKVLAREGLLRHRQEGNLSFRTFRVQVSSSKIL